MRALNVGLTLTLLAVATAGPASAQAGCTFQLGFANMRSLVGSATVGDCLENERFNTANGNAEQRTAAGMLAWRKADNWTAFTNGYETWINGPSGLQRRLNTEKFNWEGPAELTVGAPRPAAPTATPLRAAASIQWLLPSTRLGTGWYENFTNVDAGGYWAMSSALFSGGLYTAIGQAVYLPFSGTAQARLVQNVEDDLAFRSVRAVQHGGRVFELPSPGPAGSRVTKFINDRFSYITIFATKGPYLVEVNVGGVDGTSTTPSAARASEVLQLLLARVPG